MARITAARVKRRAATVLRTATSRSFRTATAAGVAQRRRQLRGDARPIIVHQPGRVGSNSVVATVRSTGTDRPVFHVHSLTSPALERALDHEREQYGSRRSVSSYLLNAAALRPELERHEIPPRPYDVITLVRDPVRRNLSALVPVTIGKLRARRPELADAPPEVIADEICAVFEADWLQRAEPFERFFTGEFIPVWGFDPLDHPFSPADGYAIMSGARARTLVLRVEDLDRVAGPAISELVGLTTGPAEKANRAADKPYRDVHSAVIERIRIPEAYIDRMYSSPYVRHFYAAAELDELRTRWLGQ
ncbi:MAG: putative capsular polysaccharide synthesis family protein [Acidimicrobiia bacterium]|nr:putative capsular polysaccharide synthesis family protein [Acidimicrobiia bacterium]